MSISCLTRIDSQRVLTDFGMSDIRADDDIVSLIKLNRCKLEDNLDISHSYVVWHSEMVYSQHTIWQAVALADTLWSEPSRFLIIGKERLFEIQFEFI